MADNEELINNVPSIRCRYCGQRNQVRLDAGDARCGRCRLPLSDAPHKKFARLDKDQYIHLRTVARSQHCAPFPVSTAR